MLASTLTSELTGNVNKMEKSFAIHEATAYKAKEVQIRSPESHKYATNGYNYNVRRKSISYK